MYFSVVFQFFSFSKIFFVLNILILLLVGSVFRADSKNRVHWNDYFFRYFFSVYFDFILLNFVCFVSFLFVCFVFLENVSKKCKHVNTLLILICFLFVAGCATIYMWNGKWNRRNFRSFVFVLLSFFLSVFLLAMGEFVLKYAA